jgi:hypothetical protein
MTARSTASWKWPSSASRFIFFRISAAASTGRTYRPPGSAILGGERRFRFMLAMVRRETSSRRALSVEIS